MYDDGSEFANVAKNVRSVLVTGGSGFFGRAFVRAALAAGVERVCVLSRSEYQQHLMRIDLPDERLRFFVGDVRDRDRVRRACEGCDTVVHAAALKRVEVGEYDSSEMVKTNVGGAITLIEAATDAGVARVIALSSDKACEPTNCYGATKLVAEKLFLAANNSRGKSGPIFIAVRYGNVAGSTGSVIPTWREAIAQGRPVHITHPNATRYWMTVDQAVRMVQHAAEMLPTSDNLLVASALPAYRVGDLAQALGVEAHVIGLGAGEKMHESMVPGQSSVDARRMSVAELKEALQYV